LLYIDAQRFFAVAADQAEVSLPHLENVDVPEPASERAQDDAYCVGSNEVSVHPLTKDAAVVQARFCQRVEVLREEVRYSGDIHV